MKKVIVCLLSVGLFCSVIFSLFAYQKKKDKESSSERTAASVSVTETASTTKEDDSNKVLLLSLCPTYGEYMNKLRSSFGISLDYVSQTESDDGKYLIADLEYNGISVTVTYLKGDKQNIKSIELYDATTSYSDAWGSSTNSIMCGLVFSFTEEIPGAFTMDEVMRGMKVTTESKEYTITGHGKYYRNGITFSSFIVAPNKQAATGLATMAVYVEIDEHYKVTPPSNS